MCDDGHISPPISWLTLLIIQHGLVITGALRQTGRLRGGFWLDAQTKHVLNKIVVFVVAVLRGLVEEGLGLTAVVDYADRIYRNIYIYLYYICKCIKLIMQTTSREIYKSLGYTVNQAVCINIYGQQKQASIKPCLKCYSKIQSV